MAIIDQTEEIRRRLEEIERERQTPTQADGHRDARYDAINEYLGTVYQPPQTRTADCA